MVIKSKGMQERVSVMAVWCGYKNLSLGITVRQHWASLVMPISDPRDRFFYPHHTPMKDTYYIIFANRPVSLHSAEYVAPWVNCQKTIKMEACDFKLLRSAKLVTLFFYLQRSGGSVM